jgi:hypothetical protein
MKTNRHSLEKENSINKFRSAYDKEVDRIIRGTESQRQTPRQTKNI